MTPLIKESTFFNHCSHELAALIYTDPNVCSFKPHIHFLMNFLILSFSLPWVSQLAPSGFPTKDFNVITIRLVRHTCYTHPHQIMSLVRGPV